LTELGLFPVRHNAKRPSAATVGAACCDLYAAFEELNDSITIPPGEIGKIPTGLIFDIPVGFSVRIHSRSGWALKHGVTLVVTEGMIDHDYTDEVFVPMINHGLKNFTIRDGDRVAQIEIKRVEPLRMKWLQEMPSPRGDRKGGFGSTGIR
tara:strand:- start:1806 stop:2258 length:453 start_codon:yes stop_codon:yes gene_type:complete